MMTENITSFPKEIETCLEYFHVKLETSGNIPEELNKKPISKFLPGIAAELVDNCVDKGAKTVHLTVTANSMRIEDDVVEKNPEKTLDLLNKIKTSRRWITTKDRERENSGDAPGGGMGIYQTMNILKLFDGDLNYYVLDGKIVAEVTWK